MDLIISSHLTPYHTRISSLGTERQQKRNANININHGQGQGQAKREVKKSPTSRQPREFIGGVSKWWLQV
ncbi:hypothetical protein PABG_12099 [Paracoccidioides brasiliensis Pb03]|uniref:Uncharacterized protein n=1 Tax=Paracoccidioides brasiliensis (strain Pb18) TaxID=502780 RepID=C1GIM0_PARBD|nr:uncharacterized protein PADG_07106 [Paracoccidioides brasiliensis Pb18]EEH42286.2 hypothetical protein PADG_07106 [Paracoccidioides brasiliensis Pb18]KGY14987.1 hypothetical protein PABG_12099 [Paracoccidioides brasiliensis Pb03]